MKNIILVISVFFLSLSTHAFDVAERYQCDCIDTGLECDGQQYMTMIFDGERLQAQQKDEDRKPTGVLLEAKLDRSYKPRKYKNFDRYLVTSAAKKVFPYFLVHKEISEDRWSKGSVKLIEGSRKNYGWTWEFQCKFDRYVNRLPAKGGKN